MAINIKRNLEKIDFGIKFVVYYLFQITAKPVTEKEKQFIEYIKNINKKYKKDGR